MALIQVNHQDLRNMANAIDNYCEIQERQMNNANASIKNMLTSDWIGPDALVFGGQWEAVDAPDSTEKRFKESLKNYSSALRACANTYQTAQEDVYNLAALLPRW